MEPVERRRRIDGRLAELHERHRGRLDERTVQYYVSGEGYASPDEVDSDTRDTFGIALVGLDGSLHSAGDAQVPFPLQSISKVFAYLLALEDHGPTAVMERVGVEPSGEAFSSIEFDEKGHRPYNPMVNSGALVTAELVQGADLDEKRDRILALVRAQAGNDDLDVDQEIYEREMSDADRNRATAYLLRSEGMLRGSPEEALELYLQQCSITLTCEDLAMMAATLANGGTNPRTGTRICGRRHIRDVLSVMYTCGMYDFAGQWAFEVGVPAKSGVSGGILAPILGKLGIGVYSPGLDSHGNSVRGVDVCEEISGRLGLHVFATEDEDALLGAPPPVPD